MHCCSICCDWELQYFIYCKSSNVLEFTTIKAAKKMCRKSVFYIDNIHNSYSVDDVKQFVSNLSVEVLSCFETKPRQRRGALYLTVAGRLSGYVSTTVTVIVCSQASEAGIQSDKQFFQLLCGNRQND